MEKTDGDGAGGTVGISEKTDGDGAGGTVRVSTGGAALS